ncbi:MAG: hypothetical protein JJT99_06260 [Rhodobacteraceae bacterium]|nr:hypothetical protein [Paracoccaceae bacterium]
MKPNFALGISETGVTLWQRAPQGWLRVGAVALDHPDMEAAFSEVVKTARKLEPGQILTKLVIPDDQILYCRVPAPATDPEEQRAQIRDGLAGRTPFPVEELDFDWTGTGPEPDVAVVARETLIEAEEFAKAQGLNPVSFVAAPANGIFALEPFFGTTRCARSILGSLDALERDDAVLREIGIASLDDPATGTKAKQDGNRGSAPAGMAAPLTPPLPPDAEIAAKTGADTVAGTASVEALSKGISPKTAATDDKTSAHRLTPVLPPKADMPDARPANELPLVPPAAKPEPTAPNGVGPLPEEDALNFKSRRQPAVGAIGAVADRKARTSKSSTPRITRQFALAGNSVKSATDLFGMTKARLAVDLKAKLAATNERISSAMQRLRKDVNQTKADEAPKMDKGKAAPMSSDVVPPAAAAKARKSEQATPGATRTDHAAKSAAPTPKAPAGAVGGAGAGSGFGAKATPPGTAKDQRIDPLERLRALASGGTSPAKDPDPEAEKLTIFGARGRGETELPGRYRILLVGGGLLMILLAAAVWAFYFTRPTVPAPELAEIPAAELGIERPEELAAELGMTEEQAIEAALAPVDTAEPGIEMEAQPAAPDAPDQPALVDRAEGASAPDAEALQGRIAGLRSAELVRPQDMAALPQAPTAPPPFDADALPPLRGSPEALALQQQPEAAPPDAAEAVPELAGEPESALPAGEEALEITVTPGRPPVAPPEKPVRFTIPETPAAPEPDAPAAPAPDALPDESQLEITITPGTPPVVPPVRPAEAIPEADEARQTPAPEAEEGEIEQAQSGVAPTPGGLALSALRPEMRPDDLAAQRPDETPAAVSEDLTPQAVANSLRPAGRPSQFATIVQRTLQAAPEQSAAPVQTAAAAAAPRIPSSASVSREATQTRAINLRQVNLIGVMGTPSNRRALVRLSNGRVVTVRVGETLDGGTVTAISETELRYNRRGRDVVLRFPS